MANARSSSLGPQLTNAQTVAGFLYLPFYLGLLSMGLKMIPQLFGLSLTPLQHNTCWFLLNTLIVWIIFHSFLLRSLRSIRFWNFLQSCVLGFVFYYALTALFNLLIDLLNVRIVSFNDEAVQAMVTDSYWIAALCTVVIAPIVEETLVRGLIFGSFRRKSRVLAYAASILFFCLMHVWGFFSSEGIVPVLLAAARYIPAAIALGWTYEKAGTVWAPITVHMLVNAISMSLI